MHWLGALATPVVVLSATLDPALAGELVAAYRSGAGTGGRPEGEVTVPYPGWLFAARDGAVRQIAERDRVAHARQTQRTAVVSHRRVRAVRWRGGAQEAGPGERLACIAEELAPLREEGGCAV
ncbi:CRISPR-associated helicase/endonuclease Cas3, partial [Streptomyces violascens]